MQISAKRLNFAAMIELERHIEILLLGNDCVIVPGLGGFMAHHSEARYDDNEHLYLPPLRTIGFNPQLKLNDSLLAQSYIEAYDISYPEAIRRIEEEVHELKQHLRNDGKYELNDIGILYINEENKYNFEPCECGILSPDLYGLDSVEIKKISKDEMTSSIADIDKEVIISENTEIEDDNLSDDKTIRIKVAWIRNAVAVAASLIAFLFITTPISNSNNSYITGNINNGIISNINPTSGSEKMHKITPKEIKAAVSQKDTITGIKPDANHNISPKGQDTGAYCIVLASRTTERNANMYIQELHKNGYKDAHIYINNNIVRVVYGHYNNESEAYSALRSAHNNEYFEQAWVYKKR